MDFLKSYFFKNKPLISCPFLSSKLDSPLIKTLERHSLNVKKVFWLQDNLILRKEMDNWSVVHSWRNNFLKNPYSNGFLTLNFEFTSGLCYKFFRSNLFHAFHWHIWHIIATFSGNVLNQKTGSRVHYKNVSVTDNLFRFQTWVGKTS
jgi:hypothetical protein